jgi:hypothetical protein
MKRSSFLKSIAALFVAPKLVTEINFKKKDLWAKENWEERLPEEIREYPLTKRGLYKIGDNKWEWYE